MPDNSGIISYPGAAPAIIPTPPVVVLVNSAGTISGPSGYVCQSAVFNNGSPFICMVGTSNGIKTLPPFTADICIPTNAGFGYVMTQAPGGPITSIGASFVQADFYLAGGGDVPGTYPFSLTAPNQITVTATYVTPIAPGPGSGSEPPNEMQYAYLPGLVLGSGASQVMGPAPTGLQQLRLWWACAMTESTGAIAIVCPNGVPGVAFARSVLAGTPEVFGPVPVGGLPLGAGNQLALANTGASSGTVSGWALITLETI